MPDALTPPQGLVAITNRPAIYGLPMGIATGGGGTHVMPSLPSVYSVGGGMKVTLVPGDWYPAVFPPVEEYPCFTQAAGSGNVVRVALDSDLPRAASGGCTRVRVIKDVVNVRNGGGGTFVSAQL